MVIDVENLFMCVHKEEDADTKQVYFYLFKLLRKGILQMSNVTVEGPLGTPPFEKPSIGKVSYTALQTWYISAHSFDNYNLTTATVYSVFLTNIYYILL